MTEYSFTLFDTAFGRGGLAWSEEGIAAIAFPGGDEAGLARTLSKRAPGAVEAPPPQEIRRLIDDISALFEGEKRDLAYAALDLEGVGEFERGVYRETLAIMPGETKTYGDIARALGDVALSQRVGQALGKNPFPIVVPCHRVVGSGGRMTGFSAPGGTEAKRRLLKLEGALAPDLFDRL
jgi:methylated-DNA-[protein]-cysteine S-methyltransferase